MQPKSASSSTAKQHFKIDPIFRSSKDSVIIDGPSQCHGTEAIQMERGLQNYLFSILLFTKFKRAEDIKTPI